MKLYGTILVVLLGYAKATAVSTSVSATKADNKSLQVQETKKVLHSLTEELSHQYEGTVVHNSNLDAPLELSLAKNIERMTATLKTAEEMLALTNEDGIEVPPALKTILAASAKHLNETKTLTEQIAVEIQTLPLEQGRRNLKVQEEDDEEEDEEEENDVAGRAGPGKSSKDGTCGATRPSGPLQHKHSSHPRIKKHTQVHEKIFQGDISYFETHFDKQKAKFSGAKRTSDEDYKSHGRRLNQAVTLSRDEQDCVQFVQCVREWSLYDVVVYFYWDDITQEGKMEAETDNASAENIFDKVEEISRALMSFKAGSRLEHTEMLGFKCNRLLRIFFQNKEHEGYTQNKPATWRDVCRGEGATRYVKFSEMASKLGELVADRIFEDTLLCTANVLGNTDMFFTSSNSPRLPIGFNTGALDRNGKLVSTHNYFTYESLSAMNGIFATSLRINNRPLFGTGGWGSVSVSSTNIETFDAACGATVDTYYKGLFDARRANGDSGTLKQPFVRHLYPAIVVACSLTGYTGGTDPAADAAAQIGSMVGEITSVFGGSGGGSTGSTTGAYTCTLTIDNSQKCSQDGFSESFATDVPGTHQVPTLWAAGTNLDQTTRMLVGEKMAPGLVCAHQQPPGFCCMDLPGQSEGPDAWGTEFDCSLGQSACIVKGPPMSGFSEETCAMHSGTYCPLPRTCQGLVDCINREIGFAITEGKDAYKQYLLNSPQINDPTKQEECGESREYFGFDTHYPNDVEICEDITFLRHNRDFQDLDAFASIPAEAITAAPLPELVPLVPPKPIAKSSQYIGQMNWKIYRMEVSQHWQEEFFEAIDMVECPSDPTDTSWNVCVVIKNAALILLMLIKSIHGNVLQDTIYNYIQGDTISDANMEEIYQLVMVSFNNTQVLAQNQEILRGGFGSLSTQNKGNQDVTINDFEFTRTEIMKEINKVCGNDPTFVYNPVNPSITTTPNGVRRLVETGEEQFETSSKEKPDKRAPIDVGPSRGAGCDGKDQDGDWVADNCEEDLFLPEIEAPGYAGYRGHARDYTVQGETFSSTAASLDFVKDTLLVKDDCAADDELDIHLRILREQDCQVTVEAVPAHVEHCDGVDQIGLPTTVMLAVDTAPPIVSCGFVGGQSADKKTLLLNEGDDLVDTELFYSIDDTCSKSPKVDVVVKSNELEEATSAFVASSWTKEEGYSASLFVSPSHCRSKAHNKASPLCMREPNVKTRIYTVSITATDEAGWQSSDTCHIVVVPAFDEEGGSESRELRGGNSNQKKWEKMPEKSKKSYLLANHSMPSTSIAMP